MAPPLSTGPMRRLAMALTASALCVALPWEARAESDVDDVELDDELDGSDEGDVVSEEATDDVDDDTNSDGASTSKDADDLGHGRQFTLRAGIVGGYRMMFRYAESPFCGPPGSTDGEFCSYGSPWATDLALGFAPLDAIELFGWARFGLGRDAETDTNAVRAFGVGARIYTISSSALKMFVQPAIAFSTEGGGEHPEWRARGATQPSYRSDLLAHFSVGPQYDFNRYFGAYGSVGMTVGVFRAISATMEGSIGLQGRYP